MSPPSGEGVEEGPELSVTFSSPAFLGPAGFERLQLILSPAPSPNVGTCPCCFPPSQRTARAEQQWVEPSRAAWELRQASENPEAIRCLEGRRSGRCLGG